MRFSHSNTCKMSNVTQCHATQHSTVAQSIRRLTTPRLLILLGMVVSCIILLNLSTDVSPTVPPRSHRRLNRVKCPKCKGFGLVPHWFWRNMDCPRCKGRTHVTRLHVTGDDETVNGFYVETIIPFERSVYDHTYDQDKHDQDVSSQSARIYWSPRNHDKTGLWRLTIYRTYKRMKGTIALGGVIKSVEEMYFIQSDALTPPVEGWIIQDNSQSTTRFQTPALSFRVEP